MTATIANAGAGTHDAYSPPDPTEPGRRYFERMCIRALAGIEAVALLCDLLRSGQDYRCWKVWCHGATAWHEAGHVTADHLLGLYPWRASIVENRSVKVGTGIMIGFASAGSEPEPPADFALPTELQTDRRTIAKCCWALSLIEPRPGWQTARQIMRRLRAETRELLQQNWPLVVRVAEALSEHETLDHRQLAAILSMSEGESR